MSDKKECAREKLIVPLDFPTFREALKFLDIVKKDIRYVKVGLELFISEGPSIIKELKNQGFKVFLDLKLHDIPATVGGAVRSAVRHGVDMMTIHASGGPKMIKKASEAARETAIAYQIPSPILLGVTVLTSIGEEDLPLLGIKNDIPTQVSALATLSKDNGLDGVVASPLEVQIVRKACGPDFKIVTPGIRPKWAETNDQVRIMTPQDAVKAGSDYIVVGRPIYKAEDPSNAVSRIITEMTW